ncbi:nucleotidyltransferase domain-containing protein [Kitasatospora sp. NPDC001539]|uniref:nucleotidyltransferase domain-containing protein n=1 Tax=Kitasatospora sp. NPDC001539 TaxID=3154384 RepID=UPI00332CC4BA
MIDQAGRLVADRFPDARAVLLAGSSAAGCATATSDLDLAVLVTDGGETYRETVRFEGRLAELFVHTEAGLAELFAADAASRRATMQSMYATGLLLADPYGAGARARARAETDLREGPPALDRATLETLRYGLTDQVDDLVDARDAVERLVVAGEVLRAAADLLCDHHRAWVGGGKWLPRRLLVADRELGAALLDGHRLVCGSGPVEPLAAAARRVLELVGGPLAEGYRRTWTGVVRRVV